MTDPTLTCDSLVRRAGDSSDPVTVEILKRDLTALLECVEALKATTSVIPVGCPCPECDVRQRGLMALSKLEEL
jgi:hypothetical protein